MQGLSFDDSHFALQLDALHRARSQSLTERSDEIALWLAHLQTDAAHVPSALRAAASDWEMLRVDHARQRQALAVCVCVCVCVCVVCVCVCVCVHAQSSLVASFFISLVLFSVSYPLSASLFRIKQEARGKDPCVSLVFMRLLG